MTNKVVFISDFFLNEIRGGAEYCNEALINLLKDKYEVLLAKSATVTPDFIETHKDGFFIVANFFQLSEDSKQRLASVPYVLFEHDHKYIRSNNPLLYVNFMAPEAQIQNKAFYENAITTVCQSKKHSEILQQNLFINNLSNFGGNIWTDAQLKVLEKNMNQEKTIEYGVARSSNKNKGMPTAIKFCQQNNLTFEFLEEQKFEDFIENLSRVKNLVFFPQWFESYNRLSIEAKILGCKLITNGLLGAASEPYFKQNGAELLATIKQNNAAIFARWEKMIETHTATHIAPLSIPKISIIVSLYKGEKFIKGFLEDMESQTIFDQCELIILNANSPEGEEEHILEFMKKHSNVVYEKLDRVTTVMETQNLALEMATGEFIAQACVDDRHAHDSLEVLAKHLMFTPTADLVYGDCLQTTKINETVESNSSGGVRYEHSKNSFSRENMIKCLPGPMPMWRRVLHDKIGYFNSDLAYAGDWDLFLRAVDHESRFKKVDKIVGLYYLNEEGLSTSKKYEKERRKEECGVFERYKHILGEKNYNTYRRYFHQFD